MVTAPGDSVLKVDPLPEKNAAFIEFRSPVECSNALALSGQELDGAKLRISRRRDYEPCPAHLLHVVVPAGLPPPTTALQQRVAKMDGSIQAGYGARPGTPAATLVMVRDRVRVRVRLGLG